ncbi:AsmA-like C-terminal domain-containing protein [Thalassospiraceae bacterium LMO-JJ14]|nr:AsmA-like C-terminal domain-containing protein [Thalassospiraceae bacterium LMO-JJ14]
MIKRTFIGVVQLVGGLGAGLAIITLLIAWQLQKGPVSLSFLTPYVERALNSGHRSFRLAIDDTTLTWAGWDRAIELRVKNVRAIGETGAAQARIPELSLSLSGRALVRGKLAPKFIELLGPEIRVRRDADGGLGIEVAAESGPSGERFATGLLSWLIKKPDPGSPMSYLETVRISGANMTFDDRMTGKVWQVPVGYLKLVRAPHGLLAEGSLQIDIENRIADISLHGSFHAEAGRLDLTASFADISPASFASLDPKFTVFEAVNMPLSGKLVIGTSLHEGINSIGFHVTGDDGTLMLPAPFAQELSVENITLNGIYNGRIGSVTLDGAEVTLMEGSTLAIPSPIDHAMPLVSMSGSGKFDMKSGIADIQRLSLNLNGPVFDLKAQASGIGGPEVVIKAETTLADVPVEQLKTYWPATMGPDPYAWVTSHLSGGRMTRADAVFSVRVQQDGSFAIDTIDGTMSAEGVDVTYLEGMPAVKNVKALMSFDADSFDVAVEQGTSGRIKLDGATIHITGLREIDQYIDIDLKAKSPVRDALELIDRKPFEFASAMKIDPKSTLGDADVDLNLYFMLAKDLAVEDVDVKAAARLTNVQMKDVVLGRGIRDGTLKLAVDTKKMEVDGNVMMGPVPVALVWNQNFGTKVPYRSQYLLAARIDDLSNVRDLGVDPGPAGDFVSGGVDATVRYTVFDNRSGRVEVNANLERAELRVPVMEWRKAAGDAGWVDVTILLENGLVKSVPSFNVIAGDLSVKGDVKYAPAGLGLERVNLKQVLFGRTDVSGAVISRPDGGWEIGLQGSELEFSPLWERLIGDRPGQDDLTLPDLTIAVELDKMWVEPQKFLSAVSGTFVHKRGIWRTALLDSKLNGGPLLSVNMAPDSDGNRVLSVKAENAGDTLRFFDLFDNMHGGQLEMRGRYDDAAALRPLRGKLRVVNYRVRNAPLMTRVLSIMALTGIVDALTGEGLNFAELDVPFTYTDGEVQIADAKATGASIGFTASGTVYTHADVLNIEGTVVPAYAINSLLGKIPLLGNILTGSEDGGGVFAANFSISGPIEDPNTTVNPLSALTPGILRNLFGAFKPDDQQVPLLGTSSLPVESQ